LRLALEGNSSDDNVQEKSQTKFGGTNGMPGRTAFEKDTASFDVGRVLEIESGPEGGSIQSNLAPSSGDMRDEYGELRGISIIIRLGGGLEYKWGLVGTLLQLSSL
jgi:hypothetical protein